MHLEYYKGYRKMSRPVEIGVIFCKLLVKQAKKKHLRKTNTQAGGYFDARI